MNTSLTTRLAAVAAAFAATLAILVGMNAMFVTLPGAAPADTSVQLAAAPAATHTAHAA